MRFAGLIVEGKGSRVGFGLIEKSDSWHLRIDLTKPNATSPQALAAIGRDRKIPWPVRSAQEGRGDLPASARESLDPCPSRAMEPSSKF